MGSGQRELVGVKREAEGGEGGSRGMNGSSSSRVGSGERAINRGEGCGDRGREVVSGSDPEYFNIEDGERKEHAIRRWKMRGSGGSGG